VGIAWLPGSGRSLAIPRSGPPRTTPRGPVADHDQVEAPAAKAEDLLGPIDVLVNVAFTSARDAGTIVQVGSALAYRGIPLQTVYCGAKHAIQGCHEALRCELLHKKQRARDDDPDADGETSRSSTGYCPAA
jgi:NAD(P)-dependent dehydrogenase (short-subunit alcohol dehydrogenase family)